MIWYNNSAFIGNCCLLYKLSVGGRGPEGAQARIVREEGVVVRKSILFLFNGVAVEERRGCYGECMTPAEVSHLLLALSRSGHQVVPLNVKSPYQVREFVHHGGPWDLAFCIAEGFLALPSTLYDGSGTPWVRRILEESGVPTTHSGAATMEICRHKEETYRRLAETGIRTPAHFVLRPEAAPLERQLLAIREMMHFPLFVKPAGGGNSIGITQQSVVYQEAELETRVREVVQELGEHPVLVETYLPGPEYTVGVVGNQGPMVLPVLGFPPDTGVRTFQVKKHTNLQELEVLQQRDPRFWKLYKIAVDTFAAVGARDLLRIDLKEDAHGNPLVIDVNGTPTLTATASLPYMAQQRGLAYDDLMELLLDTALARMDQEAQAATW